MKNKFYYISLFVKNLKFLSYSNFFKKLNMKMHVVNTLREEN